MDLGYATEEAIGEGLATQLNIPFISLHGMKIEDDIIKLADGKLLRKHLMIPFEYKEGNVNYPCCNGRSDGYVGIDDFSIITNLQVEPVIATTQDILVTLDKYYGDSEAQRVAGSMPKNVRAGKQRRSRQKMRM